MASKEEEIKRLIEMMRITNNQQNNAQALEAVAELGKQNWLYDGSLFGADLQFVNLANADLNNANLTSVNLTGAVLTSAQLVRATLNKVDFTGAKLKGAILFRANLSEANLRMSVLDDANLRGANCRQAKFEISQLNGADLLGAFLNDAYLFGTWLQRSDFSETLLFGSMFHSCDLSYAEFNDAQCNSTVFVDTDLSLAIGLDTIRHYRPSSLDVATLYKSRGQIPESFLHGCGIPKTLISELPRLTAGPQYYSCLISYNHSDGAFAQRLLKTLTEKGIYCWIDRENILPGEKWAEEIHNAVSNSDKIILCCSKTSLSDTSWVTHEIDMAFQKEEELTKRRQKRTSIIIPLNLDGYIYDTEFTGQRAIRLKTNQVENFQGWERDDSVFEHGVERLVRALRTDGGKAPPPTPKL